MMAKRYNEEPPEEDYQNLTRASHVQVLECIEKISTLETEISDAGTMRLVLFYFFA